MDLKQVSLLSVFFASSCTNIPIGQKGDLTPASPVDDFSHALDNPDSNSKPFEGLPNVIDAKPENAMPDNALSDLASNLTERAMGFYLSLDPELEAMDPGNVHQETLPDDFAGRAKILFDFMKERHETVFSKSKHAQFLAGVILSNSEPNNVGLVFSDIIKLVLDEEALNYLTPSKDVKAIAQNFLYTINQEFGVALNPTDELRFFDLLNESDRFSDIQGISGILALTIPFVSSSTALEEEFVFQSFELYEKFTEVLDELGVDLDLSPRLEI